MVYSLQEIHAKTTASVNHAPSYSSRTSVQTNARDEVTASGIAAIEATNTLRDVLVRNAAGVGDRFVGMTRRDWVRA